MRVTAASRALGDARGVLSDIIRRYWWFYAVGFVIRLLIIVCSSILDAELPVKFTDVDYTVYNDAAAAVAAGGSPYDRGTYRYSPLLAYLLLPNSVYPEWGKVLFAACDIIAAMFSAASLVLWRAAPEPRSGNGVDASSPNAINIRSAVLWSALYLFSPLAINISTRGSADAVVIALLFLLLLLLLPLANVSSAAPSPSFAAASRAVAPAAIVFGLVVHFRIYPVIYAPVILLFLCRPSRGAPKPVNGVTAQSPQLVFPRARLRLSQTAAYCAHACARIVTSPHCLAFTAISVGVFTALFVMFYALYGWTFAFETYLYHFSRKDIRHNFSPYFYSLYLSSAPQHPLPLVYGATHGSASGAAAEAASMGGALVSWLSLGALPAGSGVLASLFSAASRLPPAVYTTAVQAAPVFTVFLPQVVALLATAASLHTQLPACFLVQTLLFVTLNKVCTAQYFLWWSAYLPLVAPALAWGTSPLRAAITGAAAAALWQGTEAFWLYWGYKLEHLSEPVFVQMWLSSLLFFAVNIAIAVRVIIRTREVGINFAPSALPWDCAPAEAHVDASLITSIASAALSEPPTVSPLGGRRTSRHSSEPADAPEPKQAGGLASTSSAATVRARVRARAHDVAVSAAETSSSRSRTRSRARAPASDGAASRRRGASDSAQPRSRSRSQSRVRSRAAKGRSGK